MSNTPLLTEYQESVAPWNQTENPDKEIEVTVSITLSKTVKIKVNDYKVINQEKDEDGNYSEKIDYSDCDLKKAVEEQIYLPNEAGYLLNTSFNSGMVPPKYKAEDLLNWNIDDFVVVPE